jgi:chromosome segregation ATPase
MTTDTPRTDACLHKEREARQKAEARLAEAEDLIKRGHDGWKKAEAEVEFWKAKAHEAERSEGNMEAEVERLREQLSRAIEIADTMEQSIDNMFYAGGRVKLPIFKKLNDLKAEIRI